MTVRWSGSGVISTFFTAPPLVISAAGRGSEKVTLHAAVTIEAGDLSTQRFNSPKVFIPTPPCPSARDDGGGRQHTVISKGRMTETPPCPVVISTEAGQPPIGKPLIVQAREALINSQNRISYVFLSNAAS